MVTNVEVAERGAKAGRLQPRIIGALFLAAFLAYGMGTALVDQPLGRALVLLNSAIVLALGILLPRVLLSRQKRGPECWAAAAYLLARVVEAVLLGLGIPVQYVGDTAGFELFYNVAMLTLAVGSLPMFVLLARRRLLPVWLAYWGVAGYLLLAAGSAAEMLGFPAGLVLAVPGGLFEVALGITLLVRGFMPPPTLALPLAAPGKPVVAVIAGAGLLAMAGLAGWANFGVVTPAGEGGDRAGLPWAVIALAFVVALDVVVAIALAIFFAPVHWAGSVASAGLRIAYAAVFAAALTWLGVGDTAGFQAVWHPSLAIFGAHLVVLAWLAWRSHDVPRWLSVLVALAGAGYLVDGMIDLVAPMVAFELASVTFVGEVVLMAWLLWYAVFRSDRQRRTR